MDDVISNLETFVDMRMKTIEAAKSLLIASSVQKYISNETYEYRERVLQEHYVGLKSIQSHIKNLVPSEIFDSFPSLSEILMHADYTDTECIIILMYMIKLNVERCARIYRGTVNFSILKDYKFKSITRSELKELILSRKILYLLNADREEVEEEYLDFYDELHSNLDKFRFDVTPYRAANNMVYSHFEEMKGLDDVQFIITGLKKLKVSDEVIGFITPALKKLARRAQFKPAKAETNVEETQTSSKEETTTVSTAAKEAPKEKTKAVAQVVTKKDTAKYHKKPEYLTEQDVRDLKKFIKKYYDLYNVTLFETPDYEELLKCLDAMEKLETDNYQIRRFLEDNFKNILKDDQYIKSYDELIMLLHYFIHYEVEEKKVDNLLNKYRYLKEHFNNPVAEAIHYVDEFTYYDQGLGNELREYLEQVFIPNEEEYETIKGMIEAYVEEFKEYQERIDYEKELAKNIKSR